MKEVLAIKEVDIPWTAVTIKECLWRPIQRALLRKESTTELDVKEVDRIYEVLNKHLGEKLGITTNFPSIEQVEEYFQKRIDEGTKDCKEE